MTALEHDNLETEITSALAQLKASERKLSKKFRTLPEAPPNERAAFLSSLWDLERKAAIVEELISSLEPGSLRQ